MTSPYKSRGLYSWVHLDCYGRGHNQFKECNFRFWMLAGMLGNIFVLFVLFVGNKITLKQAFKQFKLKNQNMKIKSP